MEGIALLTVIHRYWWGRGTEAAVVNSELISMAVCFIYRVVALLATRSNRLDIQLEPCHDSPSSTSSAAMSERHRRETTAV
jgi:hypothetical protein